MKRNRIPSRSRERKERVRQKAAGLFRRRVSQAEVAHILRVTPASVSYWYAAWKKEGVKGLRSKGPPGFTSTLTIKDARAFKRAVLKGPLAHGYETDLWTLSRLRTLLKKTTGITFGRTHTWHVVRALGFTPQKPKVRAVQRDEALIKAWKAKRLPGLKKMGDNAWVFSGL